MEIATGFVEVEGGRLFHEVAGDGPAIVLIHPGLWDSRTWDPQFLAWAGAGYRVIRYDVRGYGRSSRPTGEPYSHVRDLVAVMDAAGIERAAMVGCSMGGGIELDAAIVHPERVSALVLVSAGLGGFEGTEEDEAWWEQRSRPIEDAIGAGELERAEDLRLEIWAPLGTADEAGRRIREIAFDNLHELTMDESAEEGIDPPAIERLGQISVPTLVIPADHDPPFHQEISMILAAGIPNARTAAIEGVDHVVNMRKPEEFNRVVLGFLGEVV